MRLLGALEGASLERGATALGFRFIPAPAPLPARPHRNDEASALDIQRPAFQVPESGSSTQPGKAEPTEPASARPPLRATHFGVVAHTQKLPVAETTAEPLSAPLQLADAQRLALATVAPSPRPLTPPPRLARFIRSTLRRSRPGAQLDLPRLVAALAAARMPERLPRVVATEWDPASAVVVDQSTSMMPLLDDLRAFKRLVLRDTGGRVPVYWRSHDASWHRAHPSGGRPGRSSTEAQALRHPRWLVAGDGDAPGAGLAQRHAAALARRGGGVTALLPLGHAGAAQDGRGALRVVAWDHGRALRPLRAAHAQQAVTAAELAAGTQRLLQAASAAITVEPALLRELRLLLKLPAQCEVEAWRHPDVDADAAGLCIRYDRIALYRARFLDSPDHAAFGERIAGLIDAQHRHLCPMIAAEESALATALAIADAPLRRRAEQLGAMALRQLGPGRNAHSTSAVKAFLLRSASRVDSALQQAVPADLRRAWRLAGAAGVADERAAAPRWLVCDETGLSVQPAPARGGQSLVAAIAPARRLRVASGPWQSLDRAVLPLGVELPRGGLRVETESEAFTLDVIARAALRGAAEVGRDAEGLYLLTPELGGRQARLRWVLRDGLGRFAGDATPHPDVAFGADEFGVYLDLAVHGVIQRFRWIEPGEFWMGSPDDEKERWEDEGPRHRVRLSEGFWLADTACTHALWAAVMGEKIDQVARPLRPKVDVSWNDVRGFSRRFEKRFPGVQAGLPTEAQWEYACRAGTETPFSFGANIDPGLVDYDGRRPYTGDSTGRYRGETVDVKTLPPNGWGLYEMHGNVWEWCADGKRRYGGEAVVDPTGPSEGPRLLRGGSWDLGASSVRSARRGAFGPGGASVAGVGFRPCLRSMVRQGPAEPGARTLRGRLSRPRRKGSSSLFGGGRRKR